MTRARTRRVPLAASRLPSRAALALLGLSTVVAPGIAHADVRVVTTLPDLAAIAVEVGGAHAEVKTLAAPSEDPHYVDARPSLMLPLNRADLVVANGLDLEVGWLPALLVGARNPRIQPGSPGFFDASSVVGRLEVPTTKVDRAQGDVHPGGNPHFTFDPRAARAVALALGRRLGELDPAHAADFAANAGRFAAALDRLASTERERFSRLPPAQRKVVSYHKSLAYLLDWLGLEEIATVEPKPGIAPSPGHTAQVLSAMRSTGAAVILQEEFYPRTTSQTLARMAKGRVVVIHGGTRFEDGERYVDHLQHICDDIFRALGG